MKIGKKFIKNNLTYLFLGFVLAVVVFSLNNNPSFLQANVLGLGDAALMKNNSWNVAYKLGSGVFDVYSSDFSSYDKIFFMIEYDNKSITIDEQKMTFQGNAIVSINEPGVLALTIEKTSSINENESLFMIPFTGDNKLMTIVRAVAYKQDKQKDLAIGRLDDDKVHNN